MSKYLAILTDVGKARFAAAAVAGTKVGFSDMAVGDGGGLLPVPDASGTGLVNEVYRAPLNRLHIISGAPNIIEAELIIPSSAGGFMMREAGLFDDEGICIALTNMPETYKPLREEGSGRFSVLRIQLAVVNTAVVLLKDDPAIVVATRSDVLGAVSESKDYADEQLGDHEQSRNHPDATTSDKGFVQLSSETDSDSEDKAATPAAVKAAIAAAIRGAWDLDNPPGTVKFFAENVNPNTLYPWSTWTYTGENKSIRVGKADGSNVGQTSGSDTATIKRENLPAEKINVSGKAESAELNDVETTEAGSAEFNVYRFGADGRENSKGRFSLHDVEMGDVPVPVEIQPHKHTISLTVPERSVSGETEALGQGKTISVVEEHTLLMCWARTA